MGLDVSNLLRAGILLALLLAAGCAVMDAARESGAARSVQVTLVQSLNGGWREGSEGTGWVQFLRPVALAGSLTDLYLADPPAGRVYRYDLLTARVSIMVRDGVTERTRLATAPDQSLYVVTPGWPLRHYLRSGELQPAIAPLGISGHYLDAVVEQESGIIYAVGVLGHGVERIHPSGAATLWPGGDPPFMQPSQVALGGSQVFLLDDPCACIWAASRIAPVWRRVVTELRPPSAITADARRLVLLDGGARALRVWFDGRELPPVSYRELGLVDPVALALHQGRLYVADTAAAAVLVFALEVR